jgi:hypothetical protein
LAVAPKTVSRDGRVSLVVEDEDLQGQAAHVIVTTTEGAIVAQVVTAVGG